MESQEKIREIIRAGTLAPSVDNCQPWRFAVSSDTITLYLDSGRAEFFGDYAYTASYVTMGTVIENMVLVAGRFGLQASISLFPGGADATIASITFNEGKFTDDPLADFMAKRCTNRRKFKKDPLAGSVSKDLARIPADNGARLHLFEDRKTIKRLTALAADVDGIIFDHRLLHANLFRWLRWDDTEISSTQDGMPVSTLELSGAERLFFRLLSSWRTQSFLNSFALNRAIGKINSALLENSASLGMIIMENSGDVDYLNGGRFFERVWLQATSLGLAFQPLGGLPFLLTRIIKGGSDGFSRRQYDILRAVYEELRRMMPLTEKNALIILFRLGYAGDPSGRTLRRPLEDILSS